MPTACHMGTRLDRHLHVMTYCWQMEPATCKPNRKFQHRVHIELVALRVNEGLSREELASRIGISRETVRLAEAGFLPSPRVQFALARNFGKKPLDLWPIERQRRGR